MERHAPGRLQRIAVLDPKPRLQRPAANADGRDDRDVRKRLYKQAKFFHAPIPVPDLAKLLDLAGERSIFRGHVTFHVGEIEQLR